MTTPEALGGTAEVDCAQVHSNVSLAAPPMSIS